VGTFENYERLEDAVSELMCDFGFLSILVSFLALPFTATGSLPADFVFGTFVIPMGLLAGWYVLRNALVRLAVRRQEKRVDAQAPLPSYLTWRHLGR
jgi:hypothetical protein